MKVAPLSSRSTGVQPCTVPVARCGVPCRATCSKPPLPSGSEAMSPWVVVTCQRDVAAQRPGPARGRGQGRDVLRGHPRGCPPSLRGALAAPGGDPRLMLLGREGQGLGAPGCCVEPGISTHLQPSLLGQQQGVHQGHLLLYPSSQHARSHGGCQVAPGLLQGCPWVQGGGREWMGRQQRGQPHVEAASLGLVPSTHPSLLPSSLPSMHPSVYPSVPLQPHPLTILPIIPPHHPTTLPSIPPPGCAPIPPPIRPAQWVPTHPCVLPTHQGPHALAWGAACLAHLGCRPARCPALACPPCAAPCPGPLPG